MAFRFYKKFQDLVKNKLAGKSLSTFQRLSTGYFGKGLSAAVKKSVDELKINKDEPKAKTGGLATAVKDLASKGVEGKENTKQPTLAKAVADKKKPKKTKSKEPVSTAKKKEKKPVSPGTAAINV